jgi:hypothetical protein
MERMILEHSQADVYDAGERLPSEPADPESRRLVYSNAACGWN